MIERLLTLLSEGLGGSLPIGLAAAAAWGVASVLLSPCHLAAIPLVVAFAGGGPQRSTRAAFGVSLVVALGVLAAVAVIGLVTLWLGRLIGDLGDTGNLLAGVVLVLVGLYLAGVFWFVPEPAIVPEGRRGLAAAFSAGALFGLGLGPCTFAFLAPVVGVVLARSGEDPLGAAALLAAFALGHAAVLVAAGTAGERVQGFLEWGLRSKVRPWVRRIAGIAVALAGVYAIFVS
ncbi:MAG: cytochrome C biogenesis protein [Thermoleophilia bacterium]|nr:cytochrome C biogenesis protein [Thermoleophilia bacterium]